MEEMLRHAEPEDVAGSARGLDNFDALKKAANDLLYDEAKGCEKDFTLLRTVLELMRLKARNGWSDSSFNDLLVLLKKLFPQPNSLPTSTYEAKKLICPLSLGVRKIHACVNNCILFRKEYEDLDRCTTCKNSRYKTSRSQSEGLDVALDDVEESDPCKDSNKKKIPQLVIWYLPVKDRLKCLFSNPRDAELMRWHHEKRKKDGMIRHPVDARQWKEFDIKYHKFVEDPRNGPQQPGNDMDVFLEPLLEDMRDLWEHGIRVWDEFLREYFTLHAIIFVTVNDLPALFSLLGQIKGKTGCIICVDGTVYRYLKRSKKLVYMRHRRFLRKNHSYRSQAEYFDGTIEKGVAPEPWKGDKVFRMTKNLKVVFGKTKDGLKSRKDLVDMQIRKGLHPVDEGNNGKVYLPPSCYTLTRAEKMALCKSLHGVRMPTGFSSNIKRLVSMKDLSLSGYNSHDCHVMLTVFLAIAIRAVEPIHVKMVITKLCYFFNSISQKVIDPEELGPLRTFAIQTVCELEMCFPPSFFDMMQHLIVHIMPQIIALGPLYLHQMWPFERYMSILKGYVRNRAHPEGSMIEGYTTEEVVECCIDYLKDGKAIGLPVPRHEGRLSGKGTKGKKRIHDNDYKKVKDAHFTVLQQLAIVEPYIEQHLHELQATNVGRSNRWIMKKHKHHFTEWFKNLDLPDGHTMEKRSIKMLADGPSSVYTSWQAYDLNGYTFYTKAKDKRSACQNSGVRVEAIDTTEQKSTYYGFIEEICELDYGPNMQIPLFRCQWVKHPAGVSVDNFGLTIVDFENVGHKDDPWVLADRVAQVFYVTDPSHLKKDIVISGKQRILGVDDVEDVEAYNQYENMTLFIDFRNKILRVEESIGESPKPYMRDEGVGKSVRC
ncbi:uncharacterized protein [Oryza sativa Japonica Group]|nr:uncharacterized protein LOC107279639 [Oryza sativa Japonica Group]